MNYISESQYENKLVDKLQQIEYKYINQEEMLKLRGGGSEVLVIEMISSSLKKINPSISNIKINKVIQKLKDLKGSDLITGNKEFQKLVVEGVKIFDDEKRTTNTFKLFDLENTTNNEFAVTNQFFMYSTHPQYNKQLPDLVVYCNGIPIVVMELKGISENDNLEQAYLQMENYKLYLKNLFVYNAFNILANPSSQKFGSLTAPLSRFQYWRGSTFTNDTDEIFNDLMNKDKILDVMRNYTFYTSGKFSSKIVASYHQYYGVKSTIRQVDRTISDDKREGIGKGGIFWHTQGSGKSFSMLFLTKNLSSVQRGTTFVIVTDRNDLDNQLYKTFMDSEEFIGQKIHHVKSIKDLKESLKNRKQNGVFFTTIQKFNESISELSDRKNILIISDEAHRSHTNAEGKWVYNTDTQDIEEKSGNAQYLREAFPRATFVGFTGTPVENDDKSTSEIFGEVITQYLMTDAERDGVVVEIRYESRKPVIELNNEETKNLINEHETIMNEVESQSLVPAEVEKKLNKVLQEVKRVVSDPDRIAGVSSDFINHYNSRKDLIKGKAMFVAFDRHTAFKYYKEIIKQDPSLEKNIKLIITNSNGQQDDPELLELAGTSEYRKRMAEEFKKEESDFKIAIVVDMWLTGFDVPSLDAIYIDKPIKMHNLMQAIARTNRVYTNKKEKINKEYGLVIDYIGLWSKLVDALSYYSGRATDEVRGERDINSLKPNYIANALKIYKDFGLVDLVDFKEISTDANKRLDAMKLISNEIYKDKLVQNFIAATKKINSWFNEIIPLLTPEESSMFQLLWVTRSGMISNELGKVNFGEKEVRLLNSLAKTIKFKETEVINTIEGSAILMSDIIKFIDEENNKETNHLEAAVKTNMVKSLINYVKKINFRRANDLHKKLSKLLTNYDAKYIDIDSLMEGIKSIAQEIEKMTENQTNEMGYTEEELAFFNIVMEPVKDIADFDQEMIKKITNELLDIINDDRMVNESWKYNPSMVTKVRGELKKLLIKYKYPPQNMQLTALDIVAQVIHQKNLG